MALAPARPHEASPIARNMPAKRPKRGNVANAPGCTNRCFPRPVSGRSVRYRDPGTVVNGHRRRLRSRLSVTVKSLAGTLKENGLEHSLPRGTLVLHNHLCGAAPECGVSHVERPFPAFPAFLISSLFFFSFPPRSPFPHRMSGRFSCSRTPSSPSSPGHRSGDTGRTLGRKCA